MPDNRFSGDIARNFTQALYPNLWRGLVGAFDSRAGIQGPGLRNLAIGRREFCEATRALSAYTTADLGLKGYIDLGTDSSHSAHMMSNLTVAPTDPLGLGGKNGTIMVRLWLDSLGNFNTFVSKVDGNSAANGYNFQLQNSSPQKIRLAMAGATSLDASSNTPVQEWFTAAGAWDGATWRIYLNGELDNSAARTNRPPSGNTTNFALGTLAHSVSNDMLGLFQYAYIWNRCLRPQEIRQVHGGASPLIKKDGEDRWGFSVPIVLPTEPLSYDLILSHVETPTTEPGNIVLSHAAPTFRSDGNVKAWVFYRYNDGLDTEFKLLGEVSKDKDLVVPVELKGKSVILSLVEQSNGDLKTVDPRKGKQTVFAPGASPGAESGEAGIASENLAAGDLVNIHSSGGPAVRKADAANGYPAHGFVRAAVASGATATVFFSGINDALSSLSEGAVLYLSTTAGGVTATPPSGSGQIVQQIGVSLSATELAFEPQPAVTLE